MTKTEYSKPQTISIAGTDVQQVLYQDEPVVTFAMVDTIHRRPDGTARRTFNENRERFVEGEDFLSIDQPDEIRTLGFSRPQGGTPAFVILITRRGYLKLVKPLTDDRAWEVQGEMIDRYFAVEKLAALAPDVYEMIRSDNGMSKQMNRKITEQGKAIAVMAETLNALVAVVKPGVPGIFRPGKSAGEVLAAAGFIDAPKNLAKWFGNRLEQAGCRVEGNGHSGLTYYRLFDPDRAERWLKNGGKAAVEMKIAERRGQGALALRGGALTTRELLREADGLPDGRAIVQTPGFIHFIDVSAYELDGTTEAAVIGADGFVRIGKPTLYDGHKFMGERSGMAAGKRFNMQEGVVILGRVVESRAIRARPVLAIDNAGA